MNIEQSRELFLAFRQIIRMNVSIMAQETLRFDLTPEQWIVLRTIHRHGPMTQKSVAHRTHKDTSTLTRVLDQLEKKGSITRSPHKVDRRAISLKTTVKGKTEAEEIIRIEQGLNIEIMKGIASEEIDAINQTFRKILHNMEAVRKNHSTE